MLNTDTPVSEYQLRRMLRELPRTSKKTSPSRGSGAASDADMLLIVALLPSVVQFVTKTLQQASCRPELRQGISPARMRDRYHGWHHYRRACSGLRDGLARTGEPVRWRQPFGMVTTCLQGSRIDAWEHHAAKTRCILQRRLPDRTGSRVHKPWRSTVTHYLMHLG